MCGILKKIFEGWICSRDKWKAIELEIISAIPWSNAKINCTTNTPLNFVMFILILLLKNNKLRKNKKTPTEVGVFVWINKFNCRISKIVGVKAEINLGRCVNEDLQV